MLDLPMIMQSPCNLVMKSEIRVEAPSRTLLQYEHASTNVGVSVTSSSELEGLEGLGPSYDIIDCR
jgi:hypothetical protein